WVTHPATPRNEFGVFLFRMEIELETAPERFVLHETADAWYLLFLIVVSMRLGSHLRDNRVQLIETVDLARWLKPGKNVIAARVWSYGDYMSYSIEGVRTGFLLQGDTEAERVADTGASWRAARDESWSPVPVTLQTYIVIGPGNR